MKNLNSTNHPVKQCPDCSRIEGNKKRSAWNKKSAAERDIVGNIYNDFKVIKKLDKYYGNGAYYLCECIYCGKKHEIRASALKQGDKKYCDDFTCTSNRGLNRIRLDLTGKTFGRWKVLKYSHTNSHGKVYYLCECSCDKHTRRPVEAYRLRSGESQSCGCKTSSRGEDKIAEILNALNIKYVYDTTSLNCINPKTKAQLRFDFFLPKYNCCIEFDGEQHFEECGRCEDTLADRQYRDNIKNVFCKKHNIQLIRIPYFDYNKLNKDYIKSLLE